VLIISLPATGQSHVIDSLRQIVALQRHDTIELEALLSMANEYLRKDMAMAKRYSLEVAALADSPSKAKWLGAAYNYLVTVYQQTGKPDSARYFLALTTEIVKQNPGNLKMKYNYNQGAGLFYKNQGEYKQALPYMLDNLKIWTKVDENRAGLLLNLGNLYSKMGDFKTAADYHLQSLRLFETLKNLRGQAFCMQSLGNDFFNLDELIGAENYFQRSLELKEQLDDKRGILTSTISLGDVYKDLNKHQKAATYYNAALAQADKLKLPGEEARALHQFGLLYKRMGDNQKARENFARSMALSRQMGDSVTIAITRSEVLDLDLREQKKQKTENQMLDGLNTTIRSGDRQQETIEYFRLSEYYASAGDFERSLYYLKRYHALNDSLEGNAVLIQMKTLEEQFKSDKKEKEIELLKKDQELHKAEISRERANKIIVILALISVVIIAVILINRYRVLNRTRRLVEMERMRNIIARDLHDDIGSTLSSINIISQMALKDANGSASHFQRIAQHSSSMMESMSDIVWSINPNNDSLEQVISKMKEFAAEILDPLDIRYTFSGEENLQSIKLDVSTRKNLFLIFKEAINNAAKYSSANAITIQFKKSNNSIELIIHDNGKGFDTQHGSTGNGLRNMKERASNLRGKLKLTSSGSGTEVNLSLPIT
jgi:two-component system, NarL family, sensor histidine kinase UhpB